MSEAIAFDTHKFVKRLTAGGFTERQAEVLAEEQVNLLETNLATKADMAAVRADIAAIEAVSKSDIAGIEAALKADIAAVKADLEFKMSQLEVKVEASRDGPAEMDDRRDDRAGRVDHRSSSSCCRRSRRAAGDPRDPRIPYPLNRDRGCCMRAPART